VRHVGWAKACSGYEKQYFRLASAWSVVFLIAMSFTFLAKLGDYYSRVWLGSFYVIGLICLVAFRRLVFLLVRRWTREGRLDRRTVIVGADDRGEALIRSLAGQRDSDVRLVGVFDDRGEVRTQANEVARQKPISSPSRARPGSISSSLRCRSRPRAASCRC